MKETERLDPDALIKVISQEQKRKKAGRLYVFLGMAPGVGKTYTMLLAAKEAQKEGQDVVVGVVETHGRKETEELLNGLEIIPKKESQYRNLEFKEMDLDAIIKRKPKIILVDELAHTNIPGSRHNKRWQDVFEIMDAGIDVFSTLNIQHLDSRKETIEQITNISVKETIPDNVLDRAYQIRLIDLSVEDLLKRLKEGKVYLGENAKLAVTNFFKEQNLTALREIALRTVAERVDNDLQNLTATIEASQSFAVGERLLVLVNERKESEEILRTARRLAYSLDAPWIALYIDSGLRLTNLEKNCLTKNLELARNLGGEIITTANTNLAKTIIKLVRQKNITQLILDRNQKSNVFQFITGQTLYKDLINQGLNINILLTQGDKNKSKNFLRQFFKYFDLRAPIVSYGKVIFLTILIAFLSSFLEKFLGYRSVGFIFLLFIIALGTVFSLGPMLLSAISLVFLWNYFFMPPIGSFKIKNTEDMFMCLAFIFSSLIIGVVTNKIKKREALLLSRQDRNRVLYEMGRDVAKSLRKKDMIAVVINHLDNFLPGKCDVALKKKKSFLKEFPNLEFSSIEREMTVAKWVLENAKPAGWSTDTLSAREALYLPMIGSRETIGVLAFKPNKNKLLDPDDFDLLLASTKQLSLSVEKELFLEKALEIEKLKDTKNQQKAMLKFIADEFKRPLRELITSAKFLTRSDGVIDNHTRIGLAENMLDTMEGFEYVIDNLSIMSRIIVGIFPLKKSNIQISDLVQESIDQVARRLKEHQININIEKNLPDLNIDKYICRQAISNILLNAAMYSPEETPITIEIRQVKNDIVLSISDEGPGIPEKYIGYIFDLFYRIPGSLGKGVGLGLTLAKGVIKAHGGKISIANKTPHGAVFTMAFPLPPPSP